MHPETGENRYNVKPLVPPSRISHTSSNKTNSPTAKLSHKTNNTEKCQLKKKTSMKCTKIIKKKKQLHQNQIISDAKKLCCTLTHAITLHT